MLTDKQAYWTMFLFLDDLYQRHQSDYQWDMPILLDDMQVMKDGTTSDPAQWQDWLACIPKGSISAEEAFDAMLTFLDHYRQRGERGEITRLLNVLRASRRLYGQRWADYARQVESAGVKHP